MSYKIPITFITFNRLDVTKQVFQRIREVKPERLYLVSDGPRESKPGEAETVNDVRNYLLSSIDWGCKVYTNFAEKNMGCKMRVSSGITWAFENEEYMIILEDDCLPDISFFEFAEYTLEKYKDNKNIMIVSAHKKVIDYETHYDYFFSDNPGIWGWATWKRAWDLYDLNMSDWPEYKKFNSCIYENKRFLTKLDILKHYNDAYNNLVNTWDYQWTYTIRKHKGLGIVPCVNLVRNLGIDHPDATHTVDTNITCDETGSIQKPYKYPDTISCDKNFDYQFQKRNYNAKWVLKHIKKRLLKI